MSDYTKFDPINPPPPLMTGEPDSFARRTMTTRIPDIVQQVLADHASQYQVEITQALQKLYDEIKFDRPIRPLEIAAPDAASWDEAWKAHQGKSWLNVPWYFAET